MELIQNSCNLFSFAGKHYEDVSIEKIGNKNIASYFSGVDYILLTPKDNECNFNYFRVLSEEPIYIDAGLCTKIVTKTKYTARWVVYAKEKKNIDKLILQFKEAITPNYQLEIKSIQRNENKLFREECSIFDFDLKVKNITYFAIDFTIKKPYNNCLTNDC